MNIGILTKSQEEALDKGIHEYTKHDINELCILSSAISSLVQVTSVFLMYEDGRENDQGHTRSIFNILELLIKPIDRFLSEGAPKAPKETGDEHENREN